MSQATGDGDTRARAPLCHPAPPSNAAFYPPPTTNSHEQWLIIESLGIDADLELKRVGNKQGEFSIGETPEGEHWHVLGDPWNDQDEVHDCPPGLRSRYLPERDETITAWCASAPLETRTLGYFVVHRIPGGWRREDEVSSPDICRVAYMNPGWRDKPRTEAVHSLTQLGLTHQDARAIFSLHKQRKTLTWWVELDHIRPLLEAVCRSPSSFRCLDLFRQLCAPRIKDLGLMFGDRHFRLHWDSRLYGLDRSTKDNQHIIRIHSLDGRTFNAVDLGCLVEGAKEVDNKVDDNDDDDDADFDDEAEDEGGKKSRVLLELSLGPLKFYRCTITNLERSDGSTTFVEGRLAELGDVLALRTIVPKDIGEVCITSIRCHRFFTPSTTVRDPVPDESPPELQESCPPWGAPDLLKPSFFEQSLRTQQPASNVRMANIASQSITQRAAPVPPANPTALTAQRPRLISLHHMAGRGENMGFHTASFRASTTKYPAWVPPATPTASTARHPRLISLHHSAGREVRASTMHHLAFLPLSSNPTACHPSHRLVYDRYSRNTPPPYPKIPWCLHQHLAYLRNSYNTPALASRLWARILVKLVK
ncbi:uncharacterized protein MYCGRDRAFT_97642 [Zymoseptoria tritici IPO323]|uniref:Uncharacterized protein n=1 Tax=Zymoseptoria tritici (strain CBS 115943 / IPO323) TaxID=336722 RepID=F9XR35_ZYMTI|nr:uncharacterized protein MYCGRDRAFT_97642 [Zymoseptoria tritici IPO323]EGP82356.1 hypothetical protein MYCGRDRAFT_97642 [Zymoseptoria tritici IPO323]